MIQIAICDDQKEFRNQISNLIKKYAPTDFLYDILEFCSGEEFLSSSKENKKFDIVFMDIEMQELSGIDTIKKLRQRQPSSIVFFVTSHDSYITDIFRLGTFQFLKKPISEQDFAKDLIRAISMYQRNHKMLEVTLRDGISNVKFSDILYIEVCQKQILIRTKHEEIKHPGKIKDYEQKLKGFGFINIHKSYIVNLQYIEKIMTNDIKIMGCDNLLPLSRNYRVEFLNAYGKYSNGRIL